MHCLLTLRIILPPCSFCFWNFSLCFKFVLMCSSFPIIQFYFVPIFLSAIMDSLNSLHSSASHCFCRALLFFWMLTQAIAQCLISPFTELSLNHVTWSLWWHHHHSCCSAASFYLWPVLFWLMSCAWRYIHFLVFWTHVNCSRIVPLQGVWLPTEGTHSERNSQSNNDWATWGLSREQDQESVYSDNRKADAMWFCSISLENMFF